MAGLSVIFFIWKPSALCEFILHTSLKKNISQGYFINRIKITSLEIQILIWIREIIDFNVKYIAFLKSNKITTYLEEENIKRKMPLLKIMSGVRKIDLIEIKIS